ncbi:HET-domain-containing protein [Pilatotrama ljubarskyi]|nr:HET-domain-containing protein [Pilatotrama ljubarskyi]
MRLIDTRTGLFHWANEPGDVRYAILSHVWIRDEELSFEELLAIQIAARSSPEPQQYIFGTVPPKVRELCVFARDQGIPYAWNDTCCINKNSSAELSEAINSMHKWYQLAELCVAYLGDVDDPLPVARGEHPSTEEESRWFTRGFTLQELVAPKALTFVSRTWRAFGTKHNFADVIEDVTGIPPAILTHQVSVDSVSVAQRFSWASNRNTTQEEDKAYSLMGIFGVNMPTIYGEGGYAFIRLQEEILKRLPDDTMFWTSFSTQSDYGYPGMHRWQRSPPHPSIRSLASRRMQATKRSSTSRSFPGMSPCFDAKAMSSIGTLFPQRTSFERLIPVNNATGIDIHD